jgi:hypothetical protein
LAGGVVVFALALGSTAVVAVPASKSVGHQQSVSPAAIAAVTVAAPTLPTSATSAGVPACQPAQLRAAAQSFKVALGTIVGTYQVETDGSDCRISADDRTVLAAIDGGAPAMSGALRAPNVVDITYRNPNVQTPAPLPPLPPLAVPPVTTPPLTVPPLTVPPTTLPPTTLPTPTLPTLPNNSALQPVTSALNSVQRLLSPTTTTPPPPPPPPPPPDTGPMQYPSGATGFDISWPQCGSAYPPASGVAVVGVNDGRAFTANPCLASEYAWAGGARQLYMNLNSPSDADSTDSSGPAGNCGSNRDCMAYNYGYNAAAWSYNTAASQGVRAKTWWLDVEVVGNCAPQFPTAGQGYWSCGHGLNSETVQGALDGLRQRGLVAGIYSTSYQWGQITGGANPSGGGPPNWLAGAPSSNAAGWCSGSHNFAGGPSWLLQFSPQTWDRDQAC